LPDDLSEIVGQSIHDNEYHVCDYVGSGKRGYVFRAERKLGGERALKFIPMKKLAPRWDQEALKAHQLERQPNTVKFHAIFFHGTYGVLVFDFINGKSLREWIDDQELAVGDIGWILTSLLYFRRDCLRKNLRHGDLHPGNIIIRDPEMGAPRACEVMITDFGIGYTGAVLQPKDDLSQIGHMATRMLQSVHRESLDHADRKKYEALCHSAALKSLRETSPVERGDEEEAPERIIEELEQAERTAIAPESSKLGRSHFGDYLASEQLGDRWTEWAELFVPDFPGYEDVVSRNTTVLTGTRGCGKTMVFRRLSTLLTLEVGPTKEGSGPSFAGFYLNMNDLGDAFLFRRQVPLEDTLARRVIQFFHLCLLLEIARVAGVARRKAPEDQIREYDRGNRLLFDFLVKGMGLRRPYSGPSGVISVITSELEAAKDQVRRSKTPLKRAEVLGESDWLDRLVPLLQKVMPWLGDMPVYFFLDDYSLPRVNETLQTVLNSVIFRRSDRFFFKISTESPSTFHRRDYSGKELQDPDDFELTDLGSITIDLSEEERERFLNEIFCRRCEREDKLRGRTLVDVLADFDKSWAQLARDIRREKKVVEADEGSDEGGRALYYGRKVFVNMWSGDTRSMVRVALSLLGPVLAAGDSQLPISKAEQDKVFRKTGGEFLHLLQGCTRTKRSNAVPLPSHIASWGRHLVRIAEAFKEIALHDLRARSGGRKGRDEPKQAFRIEIVDNLSLDGIERELYEDLVRYGVFLRDDRGKSVRGAIIPRLYLRRLLIPFCTLTFSKVDNIAMSASHFRDFLLRPEEFSVTWKAERALFDVKQGTLFE